jgi:hypothetical protein
MFTNCLVWITNFWNCLHFFIKRFQHESSDTQAILDVSSLGHALHAFVNGQAVGELYFTYAKETSLYLAMAMYTFVKINFITQERYQHIIS